MNIFLSYALADQKWADEFAALLHDAGLKVSNGLSDVQLGESWETSLRQRIAAADLVISIITKRSLQTPSVMFEIGAATSVGKQVLTIMTWKNEEPVVVPWEYGQRRLLRAESPRDAAEQVKRCLPEMMAAV